MPEPIKDFGRAPSSTVPFRLQGQDYEASTRVSFGDIVELIEQSSGAGRNGVDNILSMRSFLTEALTDESWERMSAALDSKDPEIFIDTAQVSDLVAWLMPQVTRRPTKPVSGSSSSSSPTGQSSTED
jgi:hypothetical protein